MEPVKARSEVPSLTDETRPQVPVIKRLPNVLAKLHGWWLSLISWYLSLTMMRYAFIKIFPAQFHSPESPIQFSPIESLDNFRLAWVFLGRAPGYGFALGLIEALGALALLFPATRLAGSCSGNRDRAQSACPGAVTPVWPCEPWALA